MKKKRRLYSKGEMNMLIDSILHPLCARNPELIAVDVLLHSSVERNLQESTIKFIRYTLPKIVQNAFDT